MKSFSIKALALACVVVAGQAQAYWGETKVNNLFATVSEPYGNLHLSICNKLSGADYEKTAYYVDAVLGLPSRHNVVARTVFALGAATAAYKTYKHFTKPAADATEGENVEANEATENVAQ